MGFRCTACDGPDARWDAGRRSALCTSCERAGPPTREPVRLGDILTVTGGALRFTAPDHTRHRPTTCRYCDATAEWHRTTGGRWILMEPGTFPVRSVPAGRRWHIAGDGTAVALRAAAPSDTCRVSHFDVCPALSASPAPRRCSPSGGTARGNVSERH